MNDDVDAMTATLAPRLALLAALVEERNLTRAAQRLGVPQPTASRWLVGLGDELGTPVAVRSGRALQLTRAGEHLAASASAALAALRGGCQRVIEEADPERGHVGLVFLHTMGERRVPELLRAFRRKHPAVRFTLSQGAHEELLRRLRAGQADLALTSPLPAAPEFAHAVLDQQPIVANLPADHSLAHRGRIRVAELADAQFVGMKPGYGLRQITDELCRSAGFEPELAFEGEEVDTVRGVVAAGLGVALLPVAERPLPPGVVEVPITPRACRQIALVWLADRPAAPAVSAFRDYVLRTASPGRSPRAR
ncbi:transcriptional regulator [Micromonospora pattaloongensis]|uniref:Transcriptional regulator n=1 Tax=Micromonospora pattaloongensis TaxID=405436 RepID=A0A1H3QXK4_9ACTN|nr:LysR family transcriptional regulator [Micromonospora pattaloongensis]SDZ17775.1 transcriptional regulator [Micromonospora pattaloongensis]